MPSIFIPLISANDVKMENEEGLSLFGTLGDEASVIDRDPQPRKRGRKPLSTLSMPPAVQLHSPSAHIIGTPFASDPTTSSPFEYPFPTSHSTTSSIPQLPSIPPPTYSLTHPKLRCSTPVVPPSLAAKKLHLLGRESSPSSDSTEEAVAG